MTILLLLRKRDDIKLNGQMTNVKFDPAQHLTKQGWKGTGTGIRLHSTSPLFMVRLKSFHTLALKNGHATRPLPVVPKKSLSGIGKDRDQAIPFWDQYVISV